jgi:multidrug transporter EmrE-like cation transporter
LLTCIFGAAGVIGFVLLFKEKSKIQFAAVVGGIVLGSFNYFATYFLMKALSSNTLESSLVFAINNMGVLLFSAFVAAIVFKEQISKINWLGISLAMIAILGLYY